jgi:outer membrane receptor protein involved in Fe transport
VFAFGALAHRGVCAADSTTSVAVNIESQSLDAALVELSKQGHVQLLISTKGLPLKVVGPLHGNLQLGAAFEALLKGTGLTYKFVGNRTVAIVQSSAPLPPQNAQPGSESGSDPAAHALGSNAVSESSTADTVAKLSDGTPTPDQALEELTVTGSRLQGTANTPTPVTVISAQRIEQLAPTSVADVLGDSPAFRQTASSTQDQRANGNFGQTNVDLRGLGIQRTLTLIDGQRVVPTNLNGTFDVNLIPTELLERIDIVTGGASAAYGSDAVSGVVNFVLKDRIDGVISSAQFGESEQGDNREPAVSIGAGSSFAEGRGHLLFGADFSDNQGIGTLYTRDWGREEAGLVSYGSLATRGNNPAEGILPNTLYSGQAAGGIITSGPLRGIAFGPGGTPYNFNYGTVYGNLMAGGGDNPGSPHANPYGNWDLEAPHKRYTALGRITYDFNDRLTGYFEYAFSHNEQSGLSSYHQEANIIVPISNPYIPASVRAAMVADDLASIDVGRYETDLGGYRLYDDDQMNRETLGFRGRVFGNWYWDAYYEHGETTSVQNVNTNIIEANYLEASYVVQGANGVPVCGPIASNPNLTAMRAAQVTAGCQPFNIFGVGSMSAAARSYIEAQSTNQDDYTQDVVSANLRGHPFSTWADKVSMATGIEHRREYASSQTTKLGEEMAFLSNNGVTYEGAYRVSEGYVETEVPLARNVPAVKSLDFNAAVRETDYSTSGAVTTWKAGLTYDLPADVRFRITRSRDIRAPSIADLYSAPVSGIMASFFNPVTGITGPEYTMGGGNAALKPEVAASWTAGLVFQPQAGWRQGFYGSIDYFNVNIKNVIVTKAASDIADACATGQTSYCSSIATVSGRLQITSIPENLDNLKTDGVDFQASYRVPIDAVRLPGNLDLHLLSTWVAHLVTVDSGLALDRAGSGANGGLPNWTTNLNMTYEIKRLTNNLRFRYTSAIKGDAALIGPGETGYSPALVNSINLNLFPSAWYLDWYGAYTLVGAGKSDCQIFAAVSNLADKQPPFGAIIAFANGGNPYDVIGRTYKVGIRFGF